MESFLSNEVSGAPVPAPPILGQPIFDGSTAKIKVSLPMAGLKTLEVFYSRQSMAGQTPETLRNESTLSQKFDISSGALEVEVLIGGLTAFDQYFFIASVTA